MSVPAQTESERLRTLHRYSIVDTPSEPAFERLTRLAAQLFSVPVAVLFLVGERYLWFKSAYGLQIGQIERDLCFCANTVLSRGVLEIPDARVDARFSAHPLIPGFPELVFYAGAPLTAPNGCNLGALAILDVSPRPALTPAEKETLSDLAAAAMDAVELRLARTVAAPETGLLRPLPGQRPTRTPESDREVQRRGRQFEILARATQHMNADLEVPLIIRKLVSSARELVGASGGAVGLVEDGRIAFREYDRDGTVFPICYTFDMGYGVPGHVLATRRPYVSDDCEHDAHVIQEIRAAIGFRNLLNVPILGRGGELLGCFEMHNIGAGQPIPQSDVEMLQALAAGAAVAIGNARVLAERNAAEEGLRKASDTVKAIIQAAPLAIVSLDSQGIVRSWNPAAERMFGWTETEVVGRPFPAVPPGKQEEFQNRLESVLNGASFADIALVRNRKDDSLVHLNFSAAPLHAAGGEIDGAMGIMADISHQHRAEEALRQSEERYRVLVELSPDAIVVHANNRVLYANEAAARLYRAASPGQMVGMAAMDLVHADFHPVVHERIADLERGLPAPMLDEKHVRLDGSVVDVEVISTAFPHEGRIAVQAVIRDVSQRKQAENALRDSETHFRAVFDGSLDAMCILDENWCYVDVNPAACLLFGCSREELIASRFGSFSHSPGTGAVDELMNRSIVQGERRGTTRWIRRDGAEMVLDYGIRPDFLPGRHLAILRDITEKIRLEQQFRQSQKLEAIGRLAGGVAHDFNNLLTIISGYTQMALEEMKQLDPLRDNLLEIDRAGERAAGLTRQLLAFSRNQILQPRVLDLNTIVADFERMLRRLIGEDIELITALEDGLGRVKVDAGQFEQVIMNLAVNARDAMPQGGKLLIETANVFFDDSPSRRLMPLPAGAYVTVAVSDTGIGMDQEILSHIFEPFFTTKEKGKGTGLGLSTVYGIIKQSGGDVRAFSEPARGTTIRIYLPRVTDDGQPATTTLPAAAAGGHETVLVVEDEGAVRTIICEILRGRGYRVLDAADAAEALLKSRQFPARIDLLITDVILPGLNGRELARRLEPLRPEMRVLQVSGYTDTPVVREGILDRPFLQKPFTPQSLAAKVREVLDRK